MSSAALALASTTTMTVAIEPGECWYGGVVDDGVRMPLTAGYARHLVDEDRGNQIQTLLVSSHGRYLWNDQPFGVVIDHHAIHLTAVQPTILGEGFGSLRGACQAASQRHFPPSGAIPDARLFTAPQYNTWIELMYDQAQEPILAYAERIIAEGYPPGVLMVDDSWQLANGTWEFNRARFSDPKAMVDRLHDLGFSVMLWVCPFISPDTAAFRHLEARQLLVRDHTGEIAIRRWWNGISAVLDLTHPDAIAWLTQQLNHLQTDYGVDGFKFDAGDPLFYRADDRTHVSGHRAAQTKAWAQCGLSWPLNEYRSCFQMAGQALAQRLRDKHHSWDDQVGLGTCIPNALALGLAGYAFVCPDMIGGGELHSMRGNAERIDQELVVRYAQCAALFPMMQFSAAPWRILSAENNALCLAAAQLHVSYAPRILALAHAAAQSGDPLMRHLAWAYPDMGYEHIRDQFLVGDDLLVAPSVTKGERTRTVHLPPGEWTDDRGQRWSGPACITIPVPLDRLPRFERMSLT